MVEMIVVVIDDNHCVVLPMIITITTTMGDSC